jgi:mono/diheme cytochrome c family protein
MKALFLAALLTAGCGRAPSNQPPGRGLYVALGCRTCHRIGGEGGKGGPDLTFVGFRHGRAWLEAWLSDPQAWKPGSLMPNPRLSPETRAKIVDYLLTLKGQDFEKVGRPWNASALGGDALARGHALYARAGCVACHGKAGAGGYPNNNVPGGKIPALIGAAERFTKEELKVKIKNGVSPARADPSGPEPLVAMPRWGEVLKEDELDAVAAYVLSLKPDASVGADW